MYDVAGIAHAAYTAVLPARAPDARPAKATRSPSSAATAAPAPKESTAPGDQPANARYLTFQDDAGEVARMGVVREAAANAGTAEPQPPEPRPSAPASGVTDDSVTRHAHEVGIPPRNAQRLPIVASDEPTLTRPLERALSSDTPTETPSLAASPVGAAPPDLPPTLSRLSRLIDDDDLDDDNATLARNPLAPCPIKPAISEDGHEPATLARALPMRPPQPTSPPNEDRPSAMTMRRDALPPPALASSESTAILTLPPRANIPEPPPPQPVHDSAPPPGTAIRTPLVMVVAPDDNATRIGPLPMPLRVAPPNAQPAPRPLPLAARPPVQRAVALVSGAVLAAAVAFLCLRGASSRDARDKEAAAAAAPPEEAALVVPAPVDLAPAAPPPVATLAALPPATATATPTPPPPPTSTSRAEAPPPKRKIVSRPAARSTIPIRREQ